MIDRTIKFPAKLSFFLFGPRQTGKSTLIRHRFKDEKVWSIDLLDNDLFLLYSKRPSLFRYEVEKKFSQEDIRVVIVDEVQKVPPLLDEVHALMEKHPGRRFVLTGSSARKLKRGAANLLAGRAVENFLFPLTTAELGERAQLDDLLLYGSLPPIFGLDDEEKRALLKTYVHTYLQEEIRSEGLARNLGEFSRFLDVAAAQFGEQLNFSAIAGECQVSRHTVQSFYSILEDTLIGLQLMPWRKSVRKRMSLHPKFYFFDMGVTNAINRHLQEPPDPVLKGRLFEQFILLEVHRAITYKQSEASLFFWRTSNGGEVDLVIEKHGKIRAAVEIKSSQNVSTAHLSGLKSFHNEHPDVPRFLVSNVRNPYDLDGVSILPWREFLNRHLFSII